ncbi:probable purple acid phosphatase 20 [Tanacetum coccineum]|uniref:Probable purple acid phosphatase 20 n=1 Tax=Tanacetum coccineum TaxID=301880 RepID=A0ABQ5F4D0_9ASTR
MKFRPCITPWLIVVIHAPWYSTKYAHKGEKESVGMRKSMERLLYKARVDLIFARHVDAYERFNRVYNHKITVARCISQLGVEATAKALLTEISVFREASLGHGEFQVVSESYAMWSWHRNEDDESVQSDSLWIKTLASDPLCN